MPANETDRVARGFHLFHCYAAGAVNDLDAILAADAEIGTASAFITYGSPEWAISESCTGFPWPPQPNYRLGCLPWDAQPAWEDYILFLASRWSAPWGSGRARLSGICVWNEWQSLGWSDPSPRLPNRYNGSGPMLTPPQLSLYASMLANLTVLAGRAAARASPADPAMLWLSTDHFLTAPPLKAGDVGHLGLYDLLDAMWPALWAGFDSGRPGSMPWGIAVHPYDGGDPRENLTAQGIYTFATLKSTVAAYQCAKLTSVGGIPPAACWGRPEVMMWASEQGWPTSKTMTKALQARNVCLAHELSVAQGLWAVTHNLFQAAVPSNQGGGGDFSLVDEPPLVNITLENGPGHATFDAYAATHPDVFGLTSDNYCCVQWKVGCAV